METFILFKDFLKTSWTSLSPFARLIFPLNRPSQDTLLGRQIPFIANLSSNEKKISWLLFIFCEKITKLQAIIGFSHLYERSLVF